MIFCNKQVQLYLLIMLELSDQNIWDATKLLYNQFKQDEQRGRLDLENLSQFKKQNIKPLYPNKVTPQGIQKYTCCQSCCTIDPGSFCCCNTTVPDESFRKLGLGMCLYFKFMKHSSIVFMILAFFSIFSCLLCFWVSVQNSFAVTSNYQTFLFSTTLGTFSSQHVKCQYQKMPSSSSLMTYSISCPYGQVSLIGATYSNQSDDNLYNCANEIKASYSQSSSPTAGGYTNSCNSAFSSCIVSFTPTTTSSSTIAVSYACLKQNYQLGDSSIKSQYLLYIVVCIDLLCCIVLVLFFVSESKAQEQQIKFFKKNQLSLNDFSLKVKGFNISTFQEEFNHFVLYLCNMLGSDFAQQLVQVKTPDRPQFVEYQNKKTQAYGNLYKLMDEQFFDNNTNPSNFKSAEYFIENNFAKDNYQKYKEKLTKYLCDFQLLEYREDNQKASRACSIFIVINSIKMKKEIYQLQQNGCFSRYFLISEKEYTLSQPPAPDLIIWKNKGKWTFIRLIISWFLTLVICAGSYLLFGYIQFKQAQFLSKYNFNIDCAVLYTSSQLITYNPSGDSQNYLTCYCKQNLLNFNNGVCDQWRSSYITFLAIPAIISVLLVIYNVIVSAFFKTLSSIQAHRLITSELFSYTIKRSFLMIMNMALIMIISNMKYNASAFETNGDLTFLWQGKYSDITPDWYINIGTIIILTMIFNITFPIIELILTNILKCIKKCWDRKLYCRQTSCKTKNQYISLYSNDIYPIQERYAFLISVILITFTFSCVIPILNIILGISIMLLYFSDKALVFKVYQTPVNYGAELHKLINKAIFIGLVGHFALSAYFLSQTNLIAPDSSIPSNQYFDSGNTRINNIINTYYILPYVILFIILAGWLLFNNTILKLCQKCSDMCKKTLSHITKYKLQHTFYQSLNNYQIARLKLMIKGQLDKLKVKSSSYKGINQNASVNQTIKDLFVNTQPDNLRMNEYQSLLNRTKNKLQAEQSLRRIQNEAQAAYLIGLPSYEIMMNDDLFQQNRKNIHLGNGLRELLQDIRNISE